MRTKHRESGVRLSLLRGFDLRLNGVGLRLSSGEQHLLAYLALCKIAQRRAHVAGTLWGDVPDIRAAGNLRSTLWRLRRLHVDLISVSTDYLSLSRAIVVDIHEAQRIAELVMDPEADVSCLELEDLPFHGELLPAWGDGWVLLERERLRQMALHVLDVLCERWTHEGRFHKAVQAGLAAVANEPLRESSQRALIAAFLAEGNPAEAIRSFKVYAETLRRELGLMPSAKLVTMVLGRGDK